MSERLLGAIVATHGDDKGLIMPPSVAPIQVIVIPIMPKEDNKVLETSQKLLSDLKSSGIRVKLDDRDIRPGQKYYDWEIKGVPLRIEIGPRDLTNSSVMFANRFGEKSSHPIDKIIDTVRQELESIEDQMLKNSKEHFNNSIKKLPNFISQGNLLEFEESIDNSSVYEIAFDGTDAQAELLEKSTGLSFLGDSMTPYKEQRTCVISGKLTNRKVFLSKTY
jgi:prolyl-tRNA synthetase